MQVFHTHNAQFAFLRKDSASGNSPKPLIVWGHGWGQTHTAFLPMAESLTQAGDHILLDFPGFGESPPPPDVWSTSNYADAIALWLKEQNMPPVIWIGHSFGCRVGLQLAARHPQCVAAMALIAGAGLKKKFPPHKKLYFRARIRLFKLLRKALPAGPFKDRIIARFGSADYNASNGVMRSILIKTVNEDLSALAPSVACPVKLVYGLQDTETPPEFGERFSKIIPNSELFLLDGLDHYSVLTGGRHQVVKILSDLIKEQNA